MIGTGDFKLGEGRLDSNSSSSLIILLLVFSLLPSYLYSQRSGTKYKFSLDTAEKKQLPFDLPSRVSLANDQSNPFKKFYLFQVDRWGNVVFDRRTSFYRYFNWKKWKYQTVIDPLTDVIGDADSTYINLVALKPDRDYVLMAARPDIALLKELLKKYCRDPKNISTLYTKGPLPSPYFARTIRERNLQAAADELKSQKIRIKASQKKDYAEKSRAYDSAKKANPENTSDPLPSRKERKVALRKELEKIKQQLKTYEFLMIPKDVVIKELKTLNEGDAFCKDSKEALVSWNPTIEDFPAFSIPSCDTCSSKSRSTREPSFLNGIISLLKVWRVEITRGDFKLDTLSVAIDFKSLADEDNNTRLKNLYHNASVLNKARQSVYNYFDDIKRGSSFLFQLANAIYAIQKNIDIVKKSIDERDQQVKRLLTSKLIMQSDLILNKGTSNYRFVTRNSSFIIPDFGLIYAGDRLFSNSSFNTVSPFLGFHVNFRSTNRNAPFWKNFNIWKIPTLQVGIPIYANGISSDGTRKQLVADKFSIFTGFGINLAHSVRITYGALFFQELSGTHGGVQTYHIQGAPCISVGIDLRLKSLFYGLSDAIDAFKK
jgi:hypothetical protein